MGLFFKKFVPSREKVRGEPGAGDGENRATVGIELTLIAPVALGAELSSWNAHSNPR